MKKILSILITGCLIVFMAVGPLYATVRAATGDGNWDSVTVGAPWSAGTPPIVTDDVRVYGGVNITIPAGVTATCHEIEMAYGANTTFTSGALVSGATYVVTTYNNNDDFSNVGGCDPTSCAATTNYHFVATGTTPTHWAHSSVLTKIATVVNNGTLTMGTGIIYLGKGATKDAKLVFGPDSVTTSASTGNIKFNNGWLHSTATAGHFAVLNGTGAIQAGTVTDALQNVDLRYVSFQNTGGIYFGPHTTTGIATSGITIDHCIGAGNNGWVIGATDTPNTVPMSISNSDFRNFTPTFTLTMRRAAMGTATYAFTHNTITYATGQHIFLLPTTSEGLVVDGSVFVSAKINSAVPITISNSFFASGDTAATPIALSDAVAASTVTRSYFRSMANNFHPIVTSGNGGTGTHLITYNIFDGPGAIGGGFVDPGDAFIPGHTPLALNENYNISIGSNAIWSGSIPPDAAVALAINNNTIVTTDSSSFLFSTEYPTPIMASGTVVANNNVAYGGGGDTMVTGTNTSGTQLISADYNTFWNVGVTYDQTVRGAAPIVAALSVNGSATTAPPPLLSAHDTAVNPRFVDLGTGVIATTNLDYTAGVRNLVRWDKLFGSGTGTTASAETYLLNINGYDDASKTQIAANASVYGVSHLIDWVRYGFSPTNGLLRNAGDDGKTIGAVEWQNPRRKQAM